MEFFVERDRSLRSREPIGITGRRLQLDFSPCSETSIFGRRETEIHLARLRMDRVRSRIEVLRVWARSNEPNRAALVENAINEYLKSEPGTLRLSLERLCDAIEREEAANRRDEDWSVARDYVRSRLRRLA
jgi:hypothetical protein